MISSSWFDVGGDSGLRVVWEDGDRVFCRGWRDGADGNRNTVLVVFPAAEQPTFDSLNRLTHEYGLKDDLDGAWAARPVALTHHNDRTTLVLEDPGGAPLDRLLGQPLDVSHFLRIAIPLAGVLRQVHERGLIHKDIKPANILLDAASGGVWLTGFGIASRLPRERQAPAPPASIAGTLAYMAPEQTGRMNRSIDARSDLYALGVTFYQMLTGSLPFTAADPMEWVHCHIARKPVPPSERLETVPAVISALVLKLLAKTAEERYQTAAGVERDLRQCLTDWEARGHIDDFPLGQQDIPDRLLIPEKLYGRAREVETLLASFDRIVKNGAPELVLVTGYSGIGKSSVVNELHKALLPPRGLFASGKFDQYKRDIPYSTLVQAFQSLVRPLLGKSDTELEIWHGAFLEALAPNARLMTDLIPELRLIIGEPPPVAELEPKQAQSRFQLVFRRFIGVFARPEHPLALFLDDLQWLDAATLDLLADLLIRSDLQHLMLIGAYRDNEVDAAHPLIRKLDAIREAGASVQEIRLAPLAQEDLGRLIADTLRCAPDRAAPLARLVHEKTGGNPFFAIQFISALAEEGLLRFDHEAARWRWELDRLHAKRYTDNVVDLMVGKLTRLPVDTQAALQRLACLGNVAEITMLSAVLGKSNDEVCSDLWEAVRLELVEHLEGSYRFIHDRVQEAAYSLIPERVRAEAHLLIGRLLVAHTPAEKREETIFEIVNQLNRGAALITSQDEREQLAELNLIAGRRAKATTAYAAAITYLTAGAALLPEDSWDRRHELTFALELHRAECELLTGALPEAEQRLNVLSTRAASTVERATVVCVCVDLYTTVGRNARAIAVGLDCLGRLGIHWSPHPTEEEARREYDRIWLQLGSRPIEELVDLPMMTDPASLATLNVLTKVFAAAMYTEANLACLVICRAVNLSLDRGNSDGSTFAYVMLGAIAGARFGDYRGGLRLGQLGYELVEQRRLWGSQARVYNQFGTHVLPWTRHFKDCRDLLRRAFEVANKNGDLTFSAYSCHALTTNLLAVGDPLPEVQRQAEHGLAFADKAQFRVVIDLIAIQLGLLRTLRGLTPKFGSFNDAEFDEIRIERRLAANPDLARAEFSYWTRKLQARFLAGDYTSAVNAASRAQSLLWIARYAVEAAEYHFYGALSLAAVCDAAAVDQRRQHVAALVAHHRQFEVWATNCPSNFENRAALVGAEIARIEGREIDAERLYERAIRSAHDYGFIHNEALANELASRFYAARGFEKIARVYLQEARYGYLRWGADGKVRQLEHIHLHLRDPPIPASLAATIGAPVERLDVGTVLKAAQTVSGEIELGKLIEKLLRIAVEHAAAERGLLILCPDDEPRIAAEATTGRGQVELTLREAALSPAELPEAVLHYVIRTGESVILEDASAQNQFSTDEYISRKLPRSILCLPLMKQSKLIGLLYLENNLASHVFTPDRISVLELLASQAAISLENARLYNDLGEREARIRRLVDSNIIGIMIGDSRGRILEANEAFLDMLGYSREDLIAGRIRWTKLTPAEWAAADQDALDQMSATGSCKPFEKEYFRKDGSRVPILVGGAFFERKRDEGVVFAIDMTDRKLAEDKLRASERRLLEAQMELAHVNRVTTMGQLTASIAHEVNQPLAGVVANAEACLRWLDRGTPDLDAARRSVKWIIDDGNRANEVIQRVRSLANKTSVEKMPLNINDVVREIAALVQRELTSHQISLQMELVTTLPMIPADRIQLQQVIINLVMNGIEAMQSITDRPRELIIRSRQEDAQQVLVSVTDAGVGMPAANADRLFDAFFTTKSSGMGMGLSICRSIIEAHGGKLWATDNLSHGATFQFTLPVNADTVS
ncbi:trifunctional serine/threonine-protein kinase/ATP-binding protein/sensor histidine kinase [Bradyrhizobium canariense]|uniref:histidine kinase n=1 Tax=Bradyrhizobium canariense TaxID=255045 RepID=A0A1H2AXN0_9BRAD|nr:trifunctional serine/threonine-protein kinase/ATP-binding protein/sensor histidine kinase [Bradyrhizobium canariense]SDT50296.1 PAS domain S-box-containing protein [Bradyrhizobium canariense]